MIKDKIWVNKYAPKKVEDSILPEHIKKVFVGYRDSGLIPNLLLSGPKGIGKTSLVLALTKELGYKVKFVNASNEGRLIDTLRVDVDQFCSTTSLVDKNARKAVIYDEVDNCTNDVQNALKALIEQYQENVTFIFTCNAKNKVIDPIQSRCYNVDFSVTKEEAPVLMCDFTDRLKFMLEDSGIEYNEDVLISLVKRRFPDFRNIVHELQTYSMVGPIDEGILTDGKVTIRSFFKAIRERNCTKMRDWILQNLHHDRHLILKQLYDVGYLLLTPDTIPDLIMIINESQNHSPIDNEIELMDVAVKIAMNCEFIN